MRLFSIASPLILFGAAWSSSSEAFLCPRRSTTIAPTTAAPRISTFARGMTETPSQRLYYVRHKDDKNLAFQSATFDELSSSFREDESVSLNGADESFDLCLDRENTRLASFEAYVLVSILAASASFSLVANFSPPSDGSTIQQLLYPGTLLVAGASALCGLHATIVFSLSILYGKTSLGLKKDSHYEDFLSKTAELRRRGFRTFSASLLLFASEIGLVLLDRVPENLRPMAAVLAAGMMTYILSDWKFVLDSANVIFASSDECAVIFKEEAKDHRFCVVNERTEEVASGINYKLEKKE